MHLSASLKFFFFFFFFLKLLTFLSPLDNLLQVLYSSFFFLSFLVESAAGRGPAVVNFSPLLKSWGVFVVLV